MITTTLNRIRAAHPCANGWQKLLQHLGKTNADDDPLPFTAILESNGLEDALWCCQAEPQYAREWRLYAVWCARQVEYLMTDQRSLTALSVAENYANGTASDGELAAARDAAWAAAWGAARDAARAAAWAAARDAARAAAWAAAGDAAWGAARDAAWAAAGDAARAAAWTAAWAAAWGAARDAAWAAAGDAARAAAWDAAWAAARAAAWAAQTKEFLRLVAETEDRSCA